MILLLFSTDFPRTHSRTFLKSPWKSFAKSFLPENQWVYSLNIELGISGFSGYSGFKNPGKPEKPEFPNILFRHMSVC
jgi:hypothetical protein